MTGGYFDFENFAEQKCASNLKQVGWMGNRKPDLMTVLTIKMHSFFLQSFKVLRLIYLVQKGLLELTITKLYRKMDKNEKSNSDTYISKW